MTQEHRINLPAVIYAHSYKIGPYKREAWLALERPTNHAPELRDGVSREITGPPEIRTRAARIEPFTCPAQATTIYCVKTGQPIGSLLEAAEYHPSAIAPQWRATDGSNLDRLQEHEPRAYVSFCLGLIDNFWRSTTHKSQKLEQVKEHHWALVRAYQLLESVPDATMMELAQALCRFLTYAPLSYRVLDQKLLTGRRSADQLAETAQAGMLLPVLEKATVRTLIHAEQYAHAGASVKMPKFEIVPESIADAAKGPSNIRSQTKSREFAKNAKMNKLMADIVREFGSEFGWKTETKQKSQASALMSRLSRNSDKLDRDSSTHMAYSEASDKERDLLEELDSIMLGGFSSEPEMEEDDIVEVRAIPRALVESLSSLKGADIQEAPTSPTATPLPRLTLLERIARNSKKD